jgi:glutamine amidotransferase
MTGIIDYGMGNLRSVQKAFEYLGEKAVISSDRKILDGCERLILPGVGSFGQGMSQLTALSLGDYVKERSSDTPVLGICLGMQFLMSRSFEDGENAGLGFCRGDVVKFAVGKVPQIGWNGVFALRSPLFDGIKENEEFYFVHSYYAAASEGETIAFCEYGVKYSAAVWNGKNVYGVQFHPEKSGGSGLKLLKNFLAIKGA